MNNRNLRVAPPICQQLACHGGYLVVAPRHPKYVRDTFIRELRSARRRGDHQDSRLLVYLRSWDGGTGAGWPATKTTPASTSFRSSSHSLIAATVVVDQDQTDQLTKNAARLVEIGDRHFSAAFHLLPEPGIIASDLRGGTDQDLRVCSAERRQNDQPPPPIGSGGKTPFGRPNRDP